MRKNVKKQLALRVLSTAALVAMVSSIATAAFAAEYNVKDGSVEIVAKDGSQSITQWADKDNNLCVKDGEGKDIRDREDSNIILTSAIKNMHLTVYNALCDIAAGSFKGGNVTLHADTDATGYVSEEGRCQLSAETIDKINAAFDKVKDGTIVPAADATVNDITPEDFEVK